MKIDSFKSYIFITTTAIGATLYFHEVFATNRRLDLTNVEVQKIKVINKRQTKIACLIALKLKVEREELRDMCNLNL